MNLPVFPPSHDLRLQSSAAENNALWPGAAFDRGGQEIAACRVCCFASSACAEHVLVPLTAAIKIGARGATAQAIVRKAHSDIMATTPTILAVAEFAACCCAEVANAASSHVA